MRAVGVLGALLALCRTQFAYVFLLAAIYLWMASGKSERGRAVLISGVVFYADVFAVDDSELQLDGEPAFFVS